MADFPRENKALFFIFNSLRNAVTAAMRCCNVLDLIMLKRCMINWKKVTSWRHIDYSLIASKELRDFLEWMGRCSIFILETPLISFFSLSIVLYSKLHFESTISI
ncbi:hypothetical protein V8G54_034552 [Vigna mungo]|uniref:Uncharacterized protein n=1 Tax=Vigna mungo TaxID=3915 RepID=A0AAQ3MRE4_VIGMU